MSVSLRHLYITCFAVKAEEFREHWKIGDWVS